MIEHQLLFLGLLMEGPKHGYDIKRAIEEELVPFIGLNLKSIYYPLARLEELGFIAKETGREGRWPEKFIYKITPKGRKKFNELIEESFLSIDRPFFEINLSLYFLRYADQKTAKRRLKARVALLKRIRNELQTAKSTLKNNQLSLPLILQHDLDLIDAEIASSSRLIVQL